ncbi:MAG TPA: tetratricopeptide repeat protein [Arcobacter sp.]|nr:tetratricopeptide repeat protein [Arcobacter sp.]
MNEPQNKELYFKGVKEYQNNNFDKAIEIFEELIKIAPNFSDPYANIAVIKKIQKDYKSSFEYLNKALKINPKNAQYHGNMGNLLREAKDYSKSIKAYLNAIKLNPKDAQNYNNLGITFEQAGDNNKAINAYKQAVKVDGTFAKAVNNIGVILYKQKKYQESADIFSIALKTDPTYYEVHSNKGACLNKLKLYDEAIDELNLAIKHKPKHSGAYTNIGNVYYKIHDYKKAIKMHEKSISLDPNGSNAYSNLANAFKQLGYTDKAIKSYQKAIELEPNFENAHFDLATTYLMKEDFLNGWKEYEWRYQKEEMRSHIVKYKDIFTSPILRLGMNIENKILLVHSEQGYGDSIQFVRFISLVKEQYKCKIILSARDELVSLFKGLDYIDEVVARESEDTPKFDYQVAMLSLPYLLEMKESKDIPLKGQYLFAPKDGNINIKKEKGIINIGINWSASVTGESYEGKVFELEYLKPLLKNKRINVYSLQVGPESQDIQKYGFENDIIDLTDQLTDFSQTAYLIDQLDLVISSDTSVAHLAGAMDKKVWIPLQKVPDWRWLKKGETSIWYKSAKLFRQKTARQWDGVFQSILAKMNKEYKLKLKK